MATTTDAPSAADAAWLERLLDAQERADAAALPALWAEVQAFTARWPEHGMGWKLQGVVAQRLGRLPESLAAKRRAAALLPDDADAHNNLANACAALGRLAEAEAGLRRALALRPRFPQAHNNLGLVLQRQGRLAEAAACYAGALAQQPDFVQAHTNWLFALSHDTEVSAAALLAAHQDFDRRHGAPLRAGWRPHANPPVPERLLRVGFVSGDLCRHAVAHFIAPIWAGWNRADMGLFAYSNTPREDDTSARLRGLVDGWTRVGALDDAALAERVRADGIDVLFDLSGHTRHHRLLAFARKPAPVQVTAIGYPHTTGLQAMDYRISDRFRLPGTMAAQYVEQIAFIPCSGAFEHLGAAPPPGPLPALAAGHLTFGSFQRTDKLTPFTLALWGRVLRALPGARLVIGAVADAATQGRLQQALAAEGVAPERLAFLPPLPMPQYLLAHRQIDILLDSHPYPGGTTSQQGLWMGVPVLTLSGESVISWQGAANLLRLGLHDWVAHDADAYVALALRHAADLERLAALRAGLRQHIAGNALTQPASVARHMQAAVRQMWRRWCAGLPAATFELAPLP